MDTAFEHLLKKLEERRIELLKHMSHGSLADHGEYKKICGIIQGLDHAAVEIKDLANKMEQQENE